MTAKARVRLEAVGKEAVRQALTGIDRQTAQSNQRRVRAVNRLEREEKESLKSVAREQKSAEREKERAQRNAHRKWVRRLREQTREAKKSAREQARAQTMAQRQRRVVAGAIFGGAAAGIRAGYGRVQAYGGALGQLGREELVATSFRNRGNAARLAARRGTDTGELLGRVNDVAQETGVPQEDLISGLSTAQARFASNFDFFEENLERLAQAARASGQPLEVVIGAIGKLADADPSLTAEDLLQSINLLTALGSAGKVEFGELAASFGQLLGVFQRDSGLHGEELVQNFGILASMMAAGGTTDRQSATRMERMVAEMNQPRTIERMNGLLGRGRNADSPIHVNGDIEQGLDMPAVFDLLRNPELQTQEAARTIFRGVEARQGFGTLQTAAGDESLMTGLRGATAESGAAEIAAIVAAVDEGSMHEANRIGINQIASFENAGGTEQEFVTNMVSAASTIGEYEAAHLGAIEALGGLKDILMGIGGTAIGLKMLGIGGGAAAGGAAAAAAGGGAVGISALFSAPVAAAAAAGVVMGTAIDGLTEYLSGQSLSSRIGEQAFNEDELREGRAPVQYTDERGVGGAGSGGIRADGTPAVFRLHPDSVAAMGAATAGAVNSQTRRQDGGAGRGHGS